MRTYNETTIDAVGNRIWQDYNVSGAVTTNTYNPTNQLLVSIPPTGAPTTSTYDRDGNLILQNTGGALTTYIWDQENRLTSLASPTAGVTTYIYSDDGKRQATINSSGTTNFVYDGDIVLEETNAAGVTEAQYTQGPGTWSLLMSQNRSGTVQYLAPDDRQNVRLVLSQASAVLDNNQYKAFLEQLNTPTQVNPYLAWGNANGRQELVGYVRTGARILLPPWGRWMNPDMLEFGGGNPNFYDLVKNSPVTWTDPHGLGPVPRWPHPPIAPEPPIVPVPISGTQPCETRTLAYCKSAVKTKIAAEDCFCNVSAMLCQTFIKDPFTDYSQRVFLDCLNKCMFEHWQKKDTPKWKVACTCQSYIAAEQNGLTNCLTKCGTADWPPGLTQGFGGLMGFPFDGSEAARVAAGQGLCCNGGFPGAPATGDFPVPWGQAGA